MKKFFALFILAAGLFIALPALAQTKVTFHGQVVDDTDAVIPGAKVVLTATDGQTRTVVADGSGSFSLPEVAVGLYQLKVEFEGFQPYVKSDLQIAAASASFKVVMKIADVSIVIAVPAENEEDTTDPTKNLSATVLEGTIIDTLPDNEDDLRTYLEGLTGAAGQGNVEILVDGFKGGRLPTRDMIMQIRVNQNPFTAESSTPGMGRVEIVTKPGNDRWRGTFGFNLRNSALDARNAFAATKPELEQNRYQFNFGGPLINKKLSFFVNAERRSLSGFSNVNAMTLDGPFVANVEAPNSSTFLGVRADYLLNDKNTLNISYNRFGSSSLNREFAARFGGGGFGGGGGGFGGGGFGGGGFGGGGATSGGSYLLPERGSNSENTNHTLQFGVLSILSPRLLLESRVRLQREYSNTTANTQGVAINVLDAFNGGGSTCCPSTRKETNLEWQEYLTLTYKKHTIKGGLQLQYGNFDAYNATNFNGTFTFSSLAQYRAVLNGERVNPNDPTSALVRPTQFTINQGDPSLRFSQYQAAWFVQDDWRLSPTFTLSLGLRHEFQANLNDKNNFAPRIGIAWSPFKDRKTTFRAGGGIFYNRLTDNLYENTLRYNGVAQQSIIIRNPEWPNPLAGDPTILATTSLKRTLDPSLQAPYNINLMGSVERQLPGGWVTTLTYNYTKGLHQFRARNINAPLLETGLRPNPTQGNIYQIESSAKSVYQGLTFGLQRRMGKWFQVFSNYTYSRTNNDSDGAMSVPVNNYDLRSEWGPASTDRRHFAFIGGSINLPQGIRLAPFITASSGSPFNITTGFDNNGDTEINDRPAGISRNSNLSASLYSQLSPALQTYLTTYYPNGVTARGPGSFNFNLNMSKSFSFGKRESSSTASATASSTPGGPMPGGSPRGGFGGGGFGGGMSGSESGRFNVQLSAQITNVFNRVNFGQYSGVLSSPYFGKSNGASGARQLEVGVRFSF
ncbi:MAG TPA: carboxypeptidase regulatory-like domain-containing protein [Blastocatellia bacterium]|nr:carboxypeptidase regulatory-like domain-containing protein [Blastocatellia bacterium]